MIPESQVKAKANYRRKTRQVCIELNPDNDSDLIEYLFNLPNKQSYIKELIRKDMKHE